MKYQLQKTNNADQNDRVVIAEHEGVMGQAEQTAWQNAELAKLTGEEAIDPATHTAYLVPENHGWFKKTEEQAQAAVPTNMIDTSRTETVEQVEGAPLSFSKIAQAEIARSQKAREAAVAQETKVRQALASLSK